MAYYDEQFISVFNEFYPFERYIIKEPKSIENLFDDLLLAEIFIPSTEIKPVFSEDNQLLFHTKVNDNDIYVKLQTPSGDSIRIGFWDLEAHIRENIRDIIYFDFGGYEWEGLYVEHDDNSDLKVALMKQKSLIEQKYGECKIKNNFQITDTINLLTEE